MFVLIVIDKIERQWITLGAGLLTIVIVFLLCMHSGTAVWETLNVASIFTVDFGTMLARVEPRRVSTGKPLSLLQA